MTLREIVETSRNALEVHKRCLELLGEDLTQNAIGKRLAKQNLRYADLLGTKVGSAVEHQKSKQRASKARRGERDALNRIADLEAMLEVHEAIPDFNPTLAPRKKAKAGRRRAAHVLMISDTHVEETVRPETVNGLNEYNLEIAEARFERVFDGQLFLADYHRQLFDLDAVVWLGGDIITGYIHQELLEGNSLSPIEAMLTAREWISTGIHRLIRDGGYGQLKIVTSFGNHGRTTIKSQISTGADNSYEYALYCILAREFADVPNVEFVVEKNALTYVDVYGTTVRFTHGDLVKFGNGIGGVAVPLRKKIAGWNATRHADLTVLGHFHQFQYGGDFMINGSLIGWNPFASAIGARYEDPQQVSFLIDEERGVLMPTPIWVDEKVVGF